jgi:dolichyl-phosphate beta-glucosyltransferase
MASSSTTAHPFPIHVSDNLVIFPPLDHQSLIIYSILALVVAAFVFLYSLLILVSPPPIRTVDSERKYLSATRPTTPQPLSSLSDPATVDLSVIIPAYNETARLPAMLELTVLHLAATFNSNSKGNSKSKVSSKSKTVLATNASPKRTYEILIVDDGSSDHTAALSLQLASQYHATHGAEIRVVKLAKNQGKGGAVRHGMLHARGRRLLMVDADGASRFEDIDRLWTALDELHPQNVKAANGHGDANAYDEDDMGVAVGSRAHLVKTDAVVKRSILRNILMYGLHTILLIIGVGHIRDTQCGFKLFTRTAAQLIFPCQHITNWIFDVELLLLAKYKDIQVVEVDVEWHEVEGSKLNVVMDSIKMLRDLLVVRGNYVLGRWKVGEKAGQRKVKRE